MENLQFANAEVHINFDPGLSPRRM